MDLLTKAVLVLAGGPGPGLMANCGLCGMVGVPVSFAQFSWDTDAVTEVCVPGFNWKSHDHTFGGRKDVGLGRRMLPCSVLEARPELSPHGGLGAGGWAYWSQRRGAGSRRCPTAPPPHSGFFVVFREGEN